jgi:predicted transcriptional regulator
MELKELKVLGLTNGEIRVYGAILALGISTINNIHERTGFERRAIYDIINKLIEKGFVTYTLERGKRTYQCAPPSKLKEEIHQKIKELKKTDSLMPEISKLYNSSKPRINLEVFRGKEGMKSVFEDTLNYKDVYFIGGGYYIMDLLPFYWPHFNKRRIKLGVRWHNLARHETKGREIPEKRLMSMKYLPKDFSGSPSVIFIFGDKIVNVLWGDEWFAFMVQSKQIAENYKRYFNYLWKSL